MPEKMLTQEAVDAISDQIKTLLKDFASDLETGYSNAPKKFKISFGATISPERSGGKTKVVTTISFDKDPRPRYHGKVTDKTEVIVGA